MDKNSLEGLIGEVSDLKELVAYQEGAVVSRTIIKQDTGTVTIFSFSEGQGLSEHVASFNALVQILDGQAEIVIAGDPHILKEGQIIIMPANKPHSLKAIKKFKMLLVMIRA